MKKFDKIYSFFYPREFLSLNNKLLILFLILSTTLITLSSIILFGYLYQNEAHRQKKDLDYIESSFAQYIGNVVWNVNSVEVNGLLNEIIKFESIDKIIVIENESIVYKKEKKSVEDFKEDRFIISKYKLYSPTDLKHSFGEVYFYTDRLYYINMISIVVLKVIVLEIVVILIALASALILFKYLVVQHLSQIVLYFNSNITVDENTPVLRLDKSKVYKDEIDVFCETINRFIIHTMKSRQIILDLKNKAEEHNRLKSLFLASVSHELRTPLNTIVGVFDVLEDANQEQKKIYLELQKKASGQLLNLVNDILDLTKIESQEFSLDSKMENIKNIILNCTEMLSLNFKENRNKIEILIADNVPSKIFLDEKRINQILLNLLTNANKFTQNGKIEISVSVIDKDHFLIKVTDSGVGMSANKTQEIFNPFIQLESNMYLNKNGVGIGLSITKRLVEHMNGKIWAESEINQGTTFYISLPMITEISDEESLKKIRNFDYKIEVFGERPKILIVDDAEENRLLLQAYLSKSNLEVEYAANGLEAIEKCNQSYFDLIFMDIQMPFMNGLDATEVIRNNQKNSKTLIVALSAYQRSTDEEQAFQKGCNLYFTKPIQKKFFLDFISSVFNMTS